jgi:hypothetical protein
MRRFGKWTIIGVLGAVLLTVGCTKQEETGEAKLTPEVQAKVDAIQKDASLTPAQKEQKIDEVTKGAAPMIPSMGGGSR